VVVAFDVWVWAGLTPEVRSQVWKTACQKVVVPGGGLHGMGIFGHECPGAQLAVLLCALKS
jgi:hypothetical protein